jgi:hypothetical protein
MSEVPLYRVPLPGFCVSYERGTPVQRAASAADAAHARGGLQRCPSDHSGATLPHRISQNAFFNEF